ncbi:hypothetical protein H0H92_005725 [Tricholoma furcatifolium]|nr:hypothetical protein H0H92_005725 [Tricholoma furcatifolium]
MNSPPSSQQFYTDIVTGVNYSRHDDASPWFPITLGPQQPSRINPALYSQASISGPSSIGFKDPADIPLPGDDDDDDLPPVDRILWKVAAPASKVGKVRVRSTDPKGKGKQPFDAPVAKRKAPSSAIGSEEPEMKKTKKRGGRSSGVANYSGDDIDMLLDIVEERLPIGGNSWNSCANEFCDWAKENGRPIRTVKSLEAKYKQLVKTSKPTGDAECPPHVERAHQIENAINEKAGTRDLDDADIVDAYNEPIEISSDDEDNGDARTARGILKPVKKTIKIEPGASPKLGPIARRVPSDHLSSASRNRASGGQAQVLLSRISSALDPVAQAAREDDRAARSLHTTQIFTLSQQIRDLQSTVESLRSRLTESDRERHAAERRADRAELISIMSGYNHRYPGTPYPTHSQRHSDPEDIIPHFAIQTPSPGIRRHVARMSPSPKFSIQLPRPQSGQHKTSMQPNDVTVVPHFSGTSGEAFSVTVTPSKSSRSFSLQVGSPSTVDSTVHGEIQGNTVDN